MRYNPDPEGVLINRGIINNVLIETDEIESKVNLFTSWIDKEIPTNFEYLFEERQKATEYALDLITCYEKGHLGTYLRYCALYSESRTMERVLEAYRRHING